MGEKDIMRFGDGTTEMATYYAPGIRATELKVRNGFELVTRNPTLPVLFNATKLMIMVLNEQRQIVWANADTMEAAGAEIIDDLQGYRPGEAFGCVNAWTNEAGCGTSQRCAQCGAVISMMACMEANETVERECLMSVSDGKNVACMEFRAVASPLMIDGHAFIMLALHDISSVKRKEALEQVFFHDIGNTIGALDGYARILQEIADEQSTEFSERLVFLIERLRREVNQQKKLIEAENGTLELDLESLRPDELLASLNKLFADHEVAVDKKLKIELDSSVPEIKTDRSLVIRVLTNMVKNAFEAVDKGMTVLVWAEQGDGYCTFKVYNAGEIPDTVASQVFKRSFSTKRAKGRGLGTYSMRLFGERYLGGIVDFVTSKEEGTVFYISLPIKGPYT